MVRSPAQRELFYHSDITNLDIKDEVDLMQEQLFHE